jgi:hypothetical protein
MFIYDASLMHGKSEQACVNRGGPTKVGVSSCLAQLVGFQVSQLLSSHLGWVVLCCVSHGLEILNLTNLFGIPYL